MNLFKYIRHGKLFSLWAKYNDLDANYMGTAIDRTVRMIYNLYGRNSFPDKTQSLLKGIDFDVQEYIAQPNVQLVAARLTETKTPPNFSGHDNTTAFLVRKPDSDNFTRKGDVFVCNPIDPTAKDAMYLGIKTYESTFKKYYLFYTKDHFERYNEVYQVLYRIEKY